MLASLIAILPRSLRDDVLLRSRDFRRFWLSSVLHGFGSQISLFAIPLCAAVVLHASPAQMGMLAALETLPFALFALPAGVWLDRSRKLPILLAAKLASALALSSVAMAYWGGMLTIEWLYGVAFVTGCASVFGISAEQVFLTAVIGRSRLVEAHARFMTTDSASRLVGPGLAGMLVQLLSAPVALLVTAGASVLSILNMRRLATPDPQPAPSQRHPLQDMLDGIRFIKHHALLLPLAFTVAAWHVLFAGYMALNILFATRVLGLSPGMLGVVQAAGGVGMLASALLMQPLVRRYGTGRTMLVGLVANTACFTLTALLPARIDGAALPSQAIYAVLLFLLDCGLMLFMRPYVALRQHCTPDHYLGRVNSTMRFLTVAVAPLGSIGTGLVADQFGIRTALSCVAVASLMLTFVVVKVSPLPHIRD
jgi:MFS family permease